MRGRPVSELNALGLEPRSSGRHAGHGLGKSEGCWFDPGSLLIHAHIHPTAESTTSLTPPSVCECVHECVHEWVNVSQYCKALWIKALYK